MKRRLPIYIFIIGAMVVASVLYGTGILGFLNDSMRYLSLPFARFAAAVGFEVSDATRQESVGELRVKAKDLEDRLAAMSVDYVKLRGLEEENRLLRETAKFLSTSGYDYVGTRVIGRKMDAHTATILIDRGTKDGLEKGMAVIAGDGIMVGKIISLSERVSTVMLITDERSRIAVSPAGAHKLFGLIQGAGNGVAQLTLVPQGEKLERNDIVVTAGTEDRVPANLALALVDSIDSRPTEAFKSAAILPLVRPDTLNMVVVLRPSALSPE
ncbi:MAG: rod shape-determining protein MreC [Patescibacteria group bacterium]|nr:rod shape-determining protein MreC [Patescibacteria group bacterium]